MRVGVKLRNPFVQQYFLEILLPLAGYFFFDWSLAIIAVFYLLDFIGSEYSYTRKLVAVAGGEGKRYVLFLASGVTIFFAILALQIWLLFNYFTTGDAVGTDSLMKELSDFVLEELWILFPLVIFMYYLKDQFTFFMPRRFLQKDTFRFFYTHQIASGLICGILALGIFLLSHTSFSDVVILIIFLVAKIIFDFSVAKFLEKKSGK